MRVLFVLPRMVAGGVERVTLSLIRELQSRGVECALALRQARGEFLPEARALCEVHEVAAGGMQQFVPGLVRVLRLWQPTHVITAFSDVGALTGLAIRLSGQPSRWIHGVHNSHAPVTARRGPVGRLRYAVDRRFAACVYRKADAVVAVSEGVRQEVLQQFRSEPERVFTIYNPVVQEHDLVARLPALRTPGEPPRLVALGRLTRQKGFDLLIQAMAQVDGPWQLDIWGEGPDAPALQALIEDYRLQGRIRLQGITDQPFAVLRQADLFVLSSRFEGLPTVLIEAVACQCAIVATDCPQGPREILDHGRLGRLVPPEDVAALARGISQTLQKPPCGSADLLARARQFTSATAGDQWMRLLSSLG